MARGLLPFGHISEGRAPNPVPLGQSTLALLVNPSAPPKKKGKKAMAKGKGKGKGKKKGGKKRGRTPNQEAAAKKPRKARGKQNVRVEIALTPTNKKGAKTAKGKTATYEAMGTRTANGKKTGKR